MSHISEEYIQTVLHKVAGVNNVQHWGYVLGEFESIAQNYFGIIIPVRLSGIRDGKEVQMQLVLKLAPTDERYRVSGAISIMFAREIFVYSVILEKYREIQHNFPIKLQYIMPQCYYVQKEYCKEVIALQDMCEEGYRPYTHEMFLDLDHVIVSLESLAKLHALSFILKHRNPKLYNEISQTCIPLTENSNKRYMDIMKDRLDKAIIKFENTDYMPLLQKLRSKCSKYFDLAVSSVQNTCICHGDIWKENILYKYEASKPSLSCMIDYQTTRIGCPAFDIIYLIISSTDTKLRQKHFNQLLSVYFLTFDKMFKAVGLESEKVYNRQMFDYDAKVVSTACLITANTALWLLNGLQEVGHVKSKIVFTTEEERERAVIKYKGIIEAMIYDLTSYGYLTLKKDD